MGVRGGRGPEPGRRRRCAFSGSGSRWPACGAVDVLAWNRRALGTARRREWRLRPHTGTTGLDGGGDRPAWRGRVRFALFTQAPRFRAVVVGLRAQAPFAAPCSLSSTSMDSEHTASTTSRSARAWAGERRPAAAASAPARRAGRSTRSAGISAFRSPDLA